MKRLSASKGFSLIEAVITSVILLVVGLAVIEILLLSINYSQQARELNIVADDMGDVLEEIKNVSFNNITVIFPHNASVDSDVVGGFLLDNENITVTYPAGTGSDPLEIEVTLTWTSSNGTVKSHTMRTLRTRML